MANYETSANRGSRFSLSVPSYLANRRAGKIGMARFITPDRATIRDLRNAHYLYEPLGITSSRVPGTQ